MADWETAPLVNPVPAAPSWQSAPLTDPSVGDYATDAMQAGGTGLLRGVTGPTGAIAGAANALAGMHSENGKIFWGDPSPSGAAPTADPMSAYTMPDYAKRQAPPGSQFYPPAAPTPPYEAKYWPGRIAETATELAPGAVAAASTGGADVPAMLSSVGRYAAAPAVGGEAAGQVFDRVAPNLAPGARAWGPLLIGGVAAIADPLNANRAAVRGPLQARNIVTDAIGQSQTPLADMQWRAFNNPDLMLADLDPRLQATLMKVIGEGGAPADQAMAMLRARGTPDASTAANAINEGNLPPNVLATLDAHQKALADIGRTERAAALTAVDPQKLDTSKAVAVIDNALTQHPPGSPIANTLTFYRGQIANGNPVRTPEMLDSLQSTLRQRAEGLASAPGATGDDKELAATLRQVRQPLADAIDQATPVLDPTNPAAGGAYKAYRQKYADEASNRDAFKRGFEVDKTASGVKGATTNSSDAWDRMINGANDPSRPWLDALSQSERESLNQGVTARLNQIASSPGGLGRLQRQLGEDGAPDFLAKVAAVKGQDYADRLSAQLGDFRSMADTNKAGEDSYAKGWADKIQLTPQTPPSILGAMYGAAMTGGVGLPGLAMLHGGALEALPTASLLAGGAAVGAGVKSLAARSAAKATSIQNRDLAQLLTLKGVSRRLLDAANGVQPGPTNAAIARAILGTGNDADQTRPWQYQLASPLPQGR